MICEIMLARNGALKKTKARSRSFEDLLEITGG
jgi:hypothetical protein